jgi:hypothetical protein
MKNIFRILIILILLSSCNSFPPNWITNSNHAVSPDGNAYIYQSSFSENDSIRISVATWIQTSIETGGAGILDIISDTDLNLEMNWQTDSTIVIKIPVNTRILRIEKSTFFGGRSTSIEYQYNLKNIMNP